MGRPEIDENEEIFIDSYCFFYAPHISFDDETRIRFTWSPLGNVIGGWMNISIKLNQVDDFLHSGRAAS